MMGVEVIDLVGQIITLVVLLGGLSYTAAKVKFVTDLNEKSLEQLRGEFKHLNSSIIGLTVEVKTVSASHAELASRLRAVENRLSQLENMVRVVK